MTNKELLAKCSERDQAFYDFFHKGFDIKSFTEQIEFNVPYIDLVDYHMVVNRHGEVFHTFMLEARLMDDVYKFFGYLRNEIIEEDTISDYCIAQVSDLDFYQLTITLS